ncbi:MAG: hypothetical protein RID42_13500 [Alphaproteobacteria bacterium]
MTELRIVVWQFVRIMVQMETEVTRRKQGRRQAPAGSVYHDWREAWEELDAKLTELGKNNVQAYATLMMDQEVVLACRNQGQIDEVVRTVDRVIKRLGDLITRKAGKIKDLNFELKEMKVLRQELLGLSES